ncbi:chemotaxis protein CheB [Dyella acidiphila]|uniref:protein-glutamate methylesterase n=1 Tax=Dyella acidiphila TaxID=2775866 RepID=A0ABR9G953_9GAMM|nr:chemotaxis protein CheB [Dyella acidiphila]MBE1160565.1 chemotaxis protein CheB [Dyella acidiphila]
MTSDPKHIALFFDDAELGSHLRAALSEHGAQIAHEGPLSSFDAAQLRQSGVDVLVVNLDDAVDDATLDRIYGLIESGDIPVVFNDAQASRALEGWDRARWARHLAAKALNSGSIDPPRPDHAREIEAPAPYEELVAAPEAAALIDEAALEDQGEELPLVHDDSAPDSETLAAELEALLASDEGGEPIESEFGSGLKYQAEDELPPLHDGDFGQHEAAAQETAVQEAALPATTAELTTSEPAAVEVAKPPAFEINLDHLSLADAGEAFTAPVIDRSTLAQQTPTPTAPEWGFVDEEAAAPAPAKNSPVFGVEKVSAADYLAPAAEQVEESELPIAPGMSLELVSMEEAIAPKHDYQPYETHLHELETAFARLLVLGAARDSGASLANFLAGLPADLKLPILLTQHQGDGAAEQLAQSLAERSALPVKVAATGARARVGEVLVVPRGQQVRVLRDGRVELSAANDGDNEQAPSIDSSFTMAANVFGRDALAIVFAGKATDAVAGAQAIHDRGGQVWVESSVSDHYSDMVHGVLAERLASFSGSPQELAVRLVEDFR